MVVTRLRAGLIGQRRAGSALLRYGVPAYLPAGLLRHLPAVPVDQRLVVPVVHATDVAEAIVRVIDRRAAGAFNLAAGSPVTGRDIAAALHARSIPVPPRVLRGAVSVSWRARLQALDPGWLDLAFAVPTLNTSRARDLLGWAPQVNAQTVLAETISGMASADSTPSPALRPRAVLDEIVTAARRGNVGRRHRT